MLMLFVSSSKLTPTPTRQRYQAHALYSALASCKRDVFMPSPPFTSTTGVRLCTWLQTPMQLQLWLPCCEEVPTPMPKTWYVDHHTHTHTHTQPEWTLSQPLLTRAHPLCRHQDGNTPKRLAALARSRTFLTRLRTSIANHANRVTSAVLCPCPCGFYAFAWFAYTLCFVPWVVAAWSWWPTS